MDKPFAAFPSWSLRIECNRCGKMTGHTVAAIVKGACRQAGLDPKEFSGHSLRSGFVTSAVEMNAPILKIVETTRHRSVDMLRVYSRRADLFREHAGAGFL
jgi:integrase